MDKSAALQGHTGQALPTNWAVYRLSSLGDVVLVTGVLRYLEQKHGYNFSVITQKGMGDIFAGHPAVKSVEELDKSALHLAGLASVCRTLAQKYKGYGLLDLHGSLRSRTLGFFWQGVLRRYPKYSAQRRVYLHKRSKSSADILNAANVTQRYAMALEATAPPAELLRPVIYVSAVEAAEAAACLHNIFGDENTSFVALHPFATHTRKQWPEGHWRELVQMLDAANIPWVTVGQGEKLFPQRKQDLIGTTTLRSLCAILSKAALLVSGDSGPLHIASGVGTPTLGMFGPTTREWGFYPCAEHDKILELPLPCRPCSLHGNGSCPHNGRCMVEITPQSVFSTITAMYQKD